MCLPLFFQPSILVVSTLSVLLLLGRRPHRRICSDTTAAGAAASSFKLNKEVKSVNENKTKNSSNFVKDCFSIRKTIDKLTNAFCTPLVPAKKNIHPLQPGGFVTYQNSLDRMVHNEIDCQIDVNGYVRDLARRSRKTNCMLKRLMRSFKNDKRKAKKKAKHNKGKEAAMTAAVTMSLTSESTQLSNVE